MHVALYEYGYYPTFTRQQMETDRKSRVAYSQPENNNITSDLFRIWSLLNCRNYTKTQILSAKLNFF
jgi:hypothetical protein